MLSIQNIESELSYAYLHAVASRAGFITEIAGRHTDDIGIDVTLRVVGRLANNSIFKRLSVDVQLKATAKKLPFKNDRYSYSLTRKNYDELRTTESTAQQLLIVFLLPKNQNEWLIHSEDALITKRCAYWLSLRGAPPSENDTSQTVYIPTANVLSVENLHELMTVFSRNEVINYEP